MKRILITGASSGIGAATALHLDRCGMEVFAAVRALDDGEDALAGASDRLRRISLDVTDAGSIAEAMATVSEHVGGAGLDGLVNNAGIGVPGPLELLSAEDLRRQLDVNVVGQVAVTQAALPLLRAAAGRIVFVGSVGGRLASQFAAAYHASKFAMEAIADAWRQELDPEEIAVILIEPSAISTPIWDKARSVSTRCSRTRTRAWLGIATGCRSSARACAARTSTASRRMTSRPPSSRR